MSRYRVVPVLSWFPRRPVLPAALLIAAMALPLAQPAEACPDWRLDGHRMTLDASRPGGLDERLALTAGGPRNLSGCPMPGVGHVTDAPDVTMTLRGSQGQDLVFRVRGECDTVLLVNDASANWHFNDDSDGLDPMVRLPAGPDGIYDIWVGTYGPATCRAELLITTQAPGRAPACPDPALTGALQRQTLAGLRTGLALQVAAGGSAQLRDCGHGTGHADDLPQVTLELSDTAPGARLDMAVTASCDTVLLVHDPAGGWHFNDDTDGLNPALSLDRVPPGRYGIWVGTYGPTPCPAELRIAASAPDAATDPGTKPPLPPVTDDPAAAPQVLAEIGNIHAVNEGPTQPSEFVLDRPVLMTRLQTYHWNGARGQAPGTISLIGPDGRTLGPWQARGEPGQGGVPNAYWVVEQQVRLLPGRYRVIDSHPASWSQNAASGGAGFFALYGVPAEPEAGPTLTDLPASGNLTGLRDRVGQSVSIRVTGAASGPVWGSDIYTDDSSVARAAVHAGLLQVGETGVVTVTILPGQSSYAASQRHGVNSSSYGAWSGSYRFDGRVDPDSRREPAPGAVSGRLIGVLAQTTNDIATPGESLSGSGRGDALFRIALAAPGETVTGIEIRNTSGIYSVWDTVPGNGLWALAAVVDGQLVSRPDSSVQIPLTRPETVIDLYVEATANQVANGVSGYRITVTLQSGRTVAIDVPASLPSGLPTADRPTPERPPVGAIRVLGATYGGNCGAPQNNVTGHIAAQCDGQASCTYVVDHTVIGDPVVGCSKDYVVVWDCGDGQSRSATVAPEAGFRRPVALECPARATDLPMGTVPAAAGTWRINANNYPGTLTLTWTGSGWTGTMNLHNRDEPLQDIRFDPATGAVEFLRPGPNQHYRGQLSGSEMRGQFNQGGGAYGFQWTASLSQRQAGADPGPAVDPGAIPAAAGTWRIDANSYLGTLTLTWTGSGWTGTMNLHNRDEPLQDIRFDPASGAIEFLRPGPNQHYRGQLSGSDMRGQFNQGGGSYVYQWTASLSQRQAGADPRDVNVTGSYQTPWGVLTLRQDGQRVLGFYPLNNGVIEGTLDGLVLTGTWV